jgi:hypothetical protein
MRINRSHHGTDHSELVHHSSQPWKHLADLDAWDIGGNWIEFSPDLNGRVRFDIEHVLMGWPTGKKNHDDGLVRQTMARLSLCAEQIRQ